MVIAMINDKEKNQLKWAKRNRREIENGINAKHKALLARADRLDPDNNILISASETKALTSGTNDPTSMFYKPRSILERTNWADSEQFGNAMLKLGGLPTGPTIEEKMAAHWENVGVGSEKGAMAAVIRSNTEAMLNPPQYPSTSMGIPDITVIRVPSNNTGLLEPTSGTQVPHFPVGLNFDVNKIQTLGVSP